MTENLLRGGDYVPDGFGGTERRYGEEGLLCEVLFRLNCRRGSFPLLPQLGSRLHLLGKEKRSVWPMLAQQYCAEALSGLGLRVTEVTIAEHTAGQISVSVSLSDENGSYSVEVDV